MSDSDNNYSGGESDYQSDADDDDDGKISDDNDDTDNDIVLDDEIDNEIESEEEIYISNDDDDLNEPRKGSDSCYIKDLDKDIIIADEDDSAIYSKLEYRKIEDSERITGAIMTYYEMVRIIGTRAQQFNFGAIPLVKNLVNIHPAKMAYIELISGMTPYIIRRHLPGKLYEEWRVDELKIIHNIDDDFFLPENFDWDELMKNADILSKKYKELLKAKV